MNNKINNLLKLVLILSITKSYARDSIQFVGGLNRYNEFSPEQFESANLQVWYEFKREVVNNNEPNIINDTMVIIVGNYSVYYDCNRETKYKNMITTNLSDSNIVNEELYLLEENIPFQEWEIHDETLEIMGCKCQIATCRFRGRDYNAWFTMEIPVNDGPYKFYWLPGLILSIEDTKGEVKFSAIGLKKLENAIITSNNKKDYIKCTPEQYKTIKKRIQQTTFCYYNNPIRETLHMTKIHMPIEDTPIEITKD